MKLVGHLSDLHTMPGMIILISLVLGLGMMSRRIGCSFLLSLSSSGLLNRLAGAFFMVNVKKNRICYPVERDKTVVFR